MRSPPNGSETALHTCGRLAPETQLSNVRLQPTGTGLMARSTRAVLSSTPLDPHAPRSVVVEVATDDPGSFAMAQALGMYRVEVQFYRDLAPRLTQLATAECHAAVFDEDTGAFTLILQDLSAARPGDVLTPSTPEEINGAINALIALQAPLWSSPELHDLNWLTDTARTHGFFDALSGRSIRSSNGSPAGWSPSMSRSAAASAASRRLGTVLAAAAGDPTRRLPPRQLHVRHHP